MHEGYLARTEAVYQWTDNTILFTFQWQRRCILQSFKASQSHVTVWTKLPRFHNTGFKGFLQLCIWISCAVMKKGNIVAVRRCGSHRCTKTEMLQTHLFQYTASSLKTALLYSVTITPVFLEDFCNFCSKYLKTYNSTLCWHTACLRHNHTKTLQLYESLHYLIT